MTALLSPFPLQPGDLVMRVSFVAALAALALLAACSPNPGSAATAGNSAVLSQAALDSVNAVDAAFAAGMNAKDTTAVFAVYAPDAKVMPPDSPVLDGAAGRAAIAGLGIITTMLVVLAVGGVATNVIGRRVLNRAESWLMMIPVFRTIYAPVKQLVVAFSPGNEYGFKRVVLVEDSAQRWVMGFLTKEFTLDRGKGRETLIAVYVPTNHLYIGDVVIFPRERAVFPDVDVEEGIRIFLTGGMSLPGALGGLPSPARRLDPGAPRPGKPA